jgi:hypothetical protein
LTDIKDTDWAYAAGFVDGEGCIAVTRSFSAQRDRFSYSVVVVVVNRERLVLDWMRDTWSGWVVRMSAPQGNARESWAWRSRTGTQAEPFLTGIRPWLRMKVAQCDNALAMIEVIRRSRYTLGRKSMPPEWLHEQEARYWRQRQINHRGASGFVHEAMHSPRKINRERMLGRTVINKSIWSG